MKKYQNSVFIFRRDLRLHDNTGLIEALRTSNLVYPCFIIDPQYFRKSSQSYCEARLQFLFECINDLQNELKNMNSHLYIFLGNPKQIISKITKLLKIDAIFVNRDYTSASKKRDLEIKNFCENKKIIFTSADDLLLHDVDKIFTKKGTPYKVFTQFFNSSRIIPIKNPQKNNLSNFSTKKINTELNFSKVKELFGTTKSNRIPIGGRKSCLKLLKNLRSLKNYDTERNYPEKNGTTNLSPHNRFGTCSIREIYKKIVEDLGRNHTLITELHWRDFFTYVMYHNPQSFSKNFRSIYDKLSWSKNKTNFKKWCEGKTGFPIVDAGMRELNHTGLMHNRVRMIVASFLTKDLHIDWKWGERYFASKLVDYDPSVNVGNWQWAASTGCDSQPWFRIFNPWIQQKKYDPSCNYIKKWVPELLDFTPDQIHNLYIENNSKSYPKPIVNHKEESNITLEMFKKISKKI